VAARAKPVTNTLSQLLYSLDFDCMGIVLLVFYIIKAIRIVRDIAISLFDTSWRSSSANIHKNKRAQLFTYTSAREET